MYYFSRKPRIEGGKITGIWNVETQSYDPYPGPAEKCGFTLEQQREIEDRLNRSGWGVRHPLAAQAEEFIEDLAKNTLTKAEPKPDDIMAETRKMLR
jgi:hypothetical protein